MIPDVTSKKSESPITLVVRRGALRRFDKLKKDTENMPVVVTWDRRRDDRTTGADRPGEDPPAGEERRKQLAFTWEMADFVVVPGEASADEPPGPELRAPAPQGNPSD